jgi:hypothetical protein
MSANFLRGFDNRSLDLGRLLWAAGFCAYVGLTGLAIVRGQAIEWVDWALGFLLIHGAGAGGAGLKDWAVARAFAVKQSALAAGQPAGEQA